LNVIAFKFILLCNNFIHNIMSKEELRNAMVGATAVKFHHWVIKQMEDNAPSQISYGLEEYPDGRLKEISHAYIKFF